MARAPLKLDEAPDETVEGLALQSKEDTQQGLDSQNNAEQGEEVERTEDGGAIIRLADRRAKKKSKDHWENLADSEDEEVLGRLSTLARDLYEDIDIDIQAATKSVEKYAAALGATGITDKAPGGASFPGASSVTHPILGEVCADFGARICRELLPPKGPAKPHIEGTVTKEKFERARRVARFQNYQSRRVMRNFASEMEQVLTQLPFSGASYVKLWREGKKPCIAFVPYDKVHRPVNADDFYSCERITHEFNISERKLKRKMRQGVYIEHEFGDAIDPEVNKVEQVAQKTTGITTPSENVDKVRTLYEVSCFGDLEGDDLDCPYIVTFDKETKTVLSCYRNWDEGDKEYERLDFLYEFGFWPFMEGKPIGLAHMLSGLPKAATGALRALLDSALANNFPGALKLKGGQSASSNMPGPGEVREIENATGLDDIRKQLIQVELNPPSQVLFTLLGFMVDSARGMVRTTFDDVIGKGRQDIPVGTMMMLIDEGTVVYSSIFARQHRSMGRLLEGQYRLNREIVENIEFADTEGDDTVTKYDFEGECTVCPVSDPRINSDMQRWTRANFVAGRAAGQTSMMLYDPYEVEKMLLDAAQVENMDVLLKKPMTPVELGAVNENVAVVLGRPIVAFPEQDHLAHLEVHTDFVMSFYGSNPAMVPSVIPPMVGHFREHMALAYAAANLKSADAAIQSVLGEMDTDEFKDLYAKADTQEKKLSVVDMMKMKDPELGKKLDLLFAAMSKPIIEEMTKTLEKVLPILAKMMQTAQQFQMPRPMDPTQAALQTAQIGAQAQTSTAQLRLQSDQAKTAQSAQAAQAKLQQEGQLSQAELALKREAMAAEEARANREMAQNDTTDRADIAQKESAVDTRHQMNIEDNQTALTITAAELAVGDKSDVSTGTGINP